MVTSERIQKAATHTVAWFQAEEETYAAIAPGKFGYERNLSYLRDGRVRNGSVWQGQLTNYWLRASRIHGAEIEAGVDPQSGRQQFAKHTNACRALVTTLVTATTDYGYETAKDLEEHGLLANAGLLDSLPFEEPATFSPAAYWRDTLAPSYETVRDILNDIERDETKVFAAAIEPLRDFMYDSFRPLIGYVALEGSLPQPGLPSGNIQVWIDAPAL